MYKRIYYSFFIVSMIAISCGQSASLSLLSPEVQFISDTMVARVKSDFIKELDSLCDIKREAMVDKMIDSLYRIEINNINGLALDRNTQLDHDE